MSDQPASTTIDPRLAGVRLCNGAGNFAGEGPVPSDASLCAMQWVSVLAGAQASTITDAPVCACRVIRKLVIACNDRWTDEDRQKLLPLIPLLVDSRASIEIEVKRGFHFADFAVRTLLPWLCDRVGRAAEGEQLRALTPVTDKATAELARRAALSVRDIFRKAAADAAAYAAAAADAAYAAAYAAAAYADAAADAAAYAAAAADAAPKPSYSDLLKKYRSEVADLMVEAIRGALAIR